MLVKNNDLFSYNVMLTLGDPCKEYVTKNKADINRRRSSLDNACSEGLLLKEAVRLGDFEG